MPDGLSVVGFGKDRRDDLERAAADDGRAADLAQIAEAAVDVLQTLIHRPGRVSLPEPALPPRLRVRGSAAAPVFRAVRALKM